jgi:polyisoprenoid-binding protein YceI
MQIQGERILTMSTLATPQTTTTTWKIDPTHSGAEFKVRHMMISNVKGHFTDVTGTLLLNEADVTQSSVEAAIEMRRFTHGMRTATPT